MGLTGNNPLRGRLTSVATVSDWTPTHQVESTGENRNLTIQQIRRPDATTSMVLFTVDSGKVKPIYRQPAEKTQ
jgi:hypothetical protein